MPTSFVELWDSILKYVVMWIIGGLLIFLAIKKEMEPTLLLPMGFGAILVNIPMSGAISRFTEAGELIGEEGALTTLFNAGIANELFPLILFIGIGAMIDFTPILTNPKLMIFGAAAQFGIFFTFCLASMFFTQNEAASIGIIGAADGPTAIVVANKLLGAENDITGAIMVAAYSYMALVPIIQPPVIKLLTTKKERRIKMDYAGKEVSKLTKILFPIVITVVAGLVAPSSVSLVGFLMFGNLIRACGVLDSLSENRTEDPCKPHHHLPWHHHRLPDGSRQVPPPQHTSYPRTWTFRIHLRYSRRRSCCKVYQPLLEKEDQPHDRCGRYFRIPHVGTCCSQDGT